MADLEKLVDEATPERAAWVTAGKAMEEEGLGMAERAIAAAMAAEAAAEELAAGVGGVDAGMAAD